MPLVVVSGFPCAGKSRRADELAAMLQEHGKNVCIARDLATEEQSERERVYGSTANEKMSRGALKAEVERTLQRDRVVIADAPNYIKGFRYELYCIARALQTPCIAVHVATSKQMCAKWNEAVSRYPPTLLNELMARFECPDSRNRWDSPLFTLEPSESLPADALLAALFESRAPAPVLAVQSQPLSATNFLHQLDAITQDVVTAILQAQATFVPGDSVAIPGCAKTTHVTLKKTVSMPELRRLRRQFVTFTKTHPVDPSLIASTFAEFLENGL